MTPSDTGCLPALVFGAAISAQAGGERNGAGTAKTPRTADHSILGIFLAAAADAFEPA
jgi:hypothetical protein